MKTLAPVHTFIPSIVNHSDNSANSGAFMSDKSFPLASKRTEANLSMSTIGLLSALVIGFLTWETHSSPSAPAPIPKQQTIHSVQ